MKKIILCAASLLMLSACRIDLQPESDLTYNGFWETQEAVKANHAGIYARFRAYNSTLWRLGEVRSDIWGGLTPESANDEQFLKNSFSPTSAGVGSWGNFYGMIHYLNDFLKNAPTVTPSNQAERNHMMGQVYGIRAYIYFTMLKTWGDVPIVTEPLTDVTDASILNKKRASKKEVAQQVKDDIAKSLELFGNDNSLFNKKNTYWSKSATLALKGESSLFFGKVLGEGTTAYQTAKEALSSITGFTLVSTYKGLWGVANENNNEFVFAFDYQQNQSQNFYHSVTTGTAAAINPLFDRFGKTASPFVSSGNNRYGPSEKLVKIFYDDLKDTRGDETFRFLFADSNGGAGYTTYNAAKYKASLLNKFIGDVIDGTRQGYANVPIYRYADVLLLLAEAKNNLGEDPSTEINAVRKRAYAPNTAPVYVNSDKTKNAKAILDERLKEFVGEGKRWWDLQRAGDNWIFQEVPSTTAFPMSSNPLKIYLPIPQSMIDADPNLVQTEGY